MKTRDKKIVLDSIDKAIEADKLNEFVIDLIEWLQQETQLSVKNICDSSLENIINGEKHKQEIKAAKKTLKKAGIII